VDLSELIDSQSILSVAMQESNIIIASLSSLSPAASPWAHFLTFAALTSAETFSISRAGSASSSTVPTLSYLCSLPGNDEILRGPSAAFRLSTAISSTTAVLGLPQLSEVYVYTLDTSSSTAPCLWKTVGILRASDSFLGNLFGALSSLVPALTALRLLRLCLLSEYYHRRSSSSAH
jgi:hypothetical protein